MAGTNGNPIIKTNGANSEALAAILASLDNPAAAMPQVWRLFDEQQGVCYVLVLAGRAGGANAEIVQRGQVLTAQRLHSVEEVAAFFGLDRLAVMQRDAVLEQRISGGHRPIASGIQRIRD